MIEPCRVLSICCLILMIGADTAFTIFGIEHFGYEEANLLTLHFSNAIGWYEFGALKMLAASFILSAKPSKTIDSLVAIACACYAMLMAYHLTLITTATK